MRESERISGPAWTCFRADFRRRWRGRSIVLAVGILLLLAGLQLVVSLWVFRLWATPGGNWVARLMGIATPGGLWFSWLGGATGLYSPLSQAVIAAEHGSTSPEGKSFLLLHGIIHSIIALPWLACHFLMPAYAADSFSPARLRRGVRAVRLSSVR